MCTDEQLDIWTGMMEVIGSFCDFVSIPTVKKFEVLYMIHV
jgi:hypothetical protein